MVDMGYNAVGLHRAGTDHRELAAGIDPVVSQLGRLILDKGVLGLLPAAATFAAALDDARVGCATALAREVVERAQQGTRTTVAATVADRFTSTSTQIASGFTPGSIIEGMR